MTKVLILPILICLVIYLPASGAGWNYEALHQFERPGTQPMAALVLHSDGNYYGTTVAGGIHGLGAVFQITPAGLLTTLASFSDSNGTAPIAGLVEATDGTLFGTTSAGGANAFGVAFKITTAGSLTKLVDFTGTSGAAKGSVPGGLVLHANGSFYGTTQAGGANGFGTVFSMTSTGTITTLLEFTGTNGAVPGSMPMGALTIDGSTLYGITNSGGSSNQGTVFKVSTSGTWTGMAEFTGAAGTKPGANPSGEVVLHTDGNLYGLAEFGGTHGFGTAFKLTTAASPIFTTLHHFDDPTGSQPVGAIVVGADNALYGATSAGGFDSWGTLFRLTTGGTHSVLADFSGEAGVIPGSTPRASLIVGADNALYGTTSAGGPGELGVVCKVTTAGTYTPLANCSLPLGWTPSGAPVDDGSGGILFPVAEGGDEGGGALLSWTSGGGLTLADPLGGPLGDNPDGGLLKVGLEFFGVTSAGAGSGRGAAYKYDSTNGTTLVNTFSTPIGSASEGALTEGTDTALYGVSREGGTSARGTVHKLTTTGTRTRLISFTGLAGTTPGRKPRGPLALASNGDFYGLTELGGSDNVGTAFRITHTGTHSLLTQFNTLGPRLPHGGLVTSSDGFLYGTTSAGGTADAGTLVQIDPATDSLTTPAEFTDGTGTAAGREPAGELALAANGSIWGLLTRGGPADEGAVFSYSSGSGLQTVASFTGTTGSTPGSGAVNTGSGINFTGGLLPQANGSILGLTAGGGTGGGGVLFQLTPLTPIQEWKLATLGDINAPDLADPDEDGLPNLVEYALGLTPTIADTAGALVPTINTYIEGDRLSVLIPRDPLHTDITVVAESSTDLLNPWTPLATSTNGQPFTGPGYVTGDSDTPGIKTVEIRDLINLPGGIRNFIRIRVIH